jgi:signal transduction histidine kinase
MACVEVADDGIGIDADLLSQVFELFAQGEPTPGREEGGLGIGLALVRSLVQLHGGTIEAHSDGPSRGARFRMCLPLRRHRSRIGDSMASNCHRTHTSLT